MATADARARLDLREDWVERTVNRWGPYAGLALGTAVSPFFYPLDGRVVGPLVIAAAGWTALFTFRRPPLAEASRPGTVYVVGMLALALALIHESPFYGFYVFVGYYHSFTYLRGRWRWAGVTATAFLASYSQLGGGQAVVTPGFLVALVGLMAVNGVLAGGFTYYGSLTTELSQRRKEENAELAEANRRLSETLAENADLHAQLLAHAREAGVVDERARMAREIHDTIAQGLSGVVTQLEAAGSADDDPEARHRHIAVAGALARESLTEARRSVAALAPGLLADARLPDAIADMAKSWGSTAGVTVAVDTTGDPRPLLPEIEVTLFRVAQESLANVGKHAHATRAGLTLSYMDDVVVLDVRDDGVGFGPDAGPDPAAGSGFGLTGMEARVRRVAGTLTVESEPGEGTAISASVPALSASSAPDDGTEAP